MGIVLDDPPAQTRSRPSVLLLKLFGVCANRERPRFWIVEKFEHSPPSIHYVYALSALDDYDWHVENQRSYYWH